MSQLPQPPAPFSSGTDFGREVDNAGRVSVVDALRNRLDRTARADALRYQLGMGSIGFLGGLALIVPFVLWSTSATTTTGQSSGLSKPATISAVLATDASRSPALVSVPTIATRESSVGINRSHSQRGSASDTIETIETARNLIRAGEIEAARRLLSQPEIEESGHALFMLAETYDPNVLAALGATGVLAEAEMARHYYQAALTEGVEAAAARLEALE